MMNEEDLQLVLESDASPANKRKAIRDYMDGLSVKELRKKEATLYKVIAELYESEFGL